MFGRAVQFKLEYILCEYAITCHFTISFFDIDFNAYAQSIFSYTYILIVVVVAVVIIVELLHIIKRKYGYFEKLN